MPIYMQESDKKEFFEFLKNYWNPDFIYVKDNSYFNYEFSGNSNFVLSKKNGKIVAILGFLEYDDRKGDIFNAVWKNSGKEDDGLKCLQFLLNAGYKSVSSCGINKKTIPIYQFFGINTGRLKHFYILNQEIEEYKIAKISKKDIKKVKYEKVNNVIEVNNINELLNLINYQELKNYNFYKSPEYFNKRYFKHPYYKYHILVKSTNTNSILVYRIVKENGGSCIRIMDFLGDEKEFNEFISYLIEKMFQEKHEYIDIYETGLEDSTLKNTGFIERIENDINIIPNYFEPFVQKNIEIYYMTTCKSKFRMFKGDGDQDRPSIVKEKKDE